MDLPRSSFYYAPVPITEENLTLMRLLDEQYTATPFYGSHRMQVALQGAGHQVNRKHVQRLIRRMGLEAVGPKPRLSEAHPGHRVYPYLLRNVPIVRVDQVWSTDMTYVRLRHGFVYLVAILDWFSRRVYRRTAGGFAAERRQYTSRDTRRRHEAKLVRSPEYLHPRQGNQPHFHSQDRYITVIKGTW